LWLRDRSSDMATAREYFDKDSSANLRIDEVHTVSDPLSGERHEIKVALALDFEAGAKFGLLLVPDTASAEAIIIPATQTLSQT